MIVFSSLNSDQIDLKRTHAKGVEGLKKFLEFAETGKQVDYSNNQTLEKNTVLVKQIANAISSMGYLTNTFVGRSNFKVDIAVASPKNPNKYILGIMCDGKNYYQTKTTRDREIVQPAILHSLSWHTVRIYSIDWYKNKKRVIDLLIDKLKNIESNEDNDNVLKQDPNIYKFNLDTIKQENLKETHEIISNKRPYEETKFSSDIFLNYLDHENIKNNIEKILNIEEPVTLTYLYKLIARLYGFSRAGSELKLIVNNLCLNFYKDPLITKDCVYFWKTEDDSKNYKIYRSPSPRSINEIPTIEIVNAIKEILKNEVSLSVDDIPKVTAQALGYARTGATIYSVIINVIELMKIKRIVFNKNNMLTLVE